MHRRFRIYCRYVCAGSLTHQLHTSNGARSSIGADLRIAKRREAFGWRINWLKIAFVERESWSETSIFSNYVLLTAAAKPKRGGQAVNPWVEDEKFRLPLLTGNPFLNVMMRGEGQMDITYTMILIMNSFICMEVINFVRLKNTALCCWLLSVLWASCEAKRLHSTRIFILADSHACISNYMRLMLAHEELQSRREMRTRRDTSAERREEVDNNKLQDNKR